MNATRVNKWRTAQAFFIAPLIVPFVLVLPVPGRDNFVHVSLAGLFAGFFICLLYSLPIAYASELLLGIPTWMLFKHYGFRSVIAFAAAGALLGVVAYSVMEALSAYLASDPWTSLFGALSSPSPYLPACVIAGTASAVVFRAVAFSGSQAGDSA
jgi:hypothetical protein